MIAHSGKSIKQWGFLILIAIAVFITLQIALNTPFNFHPDEISHADAICYFESHWWPPPVNSDEVIYCPAGWSRVYTGEVVYLIYGKMSVLAKPIASRIFAAPGVVSSSFPFPPRIYLPVVLRLPNCIMSPELYRILNVALLIFTLLVVFSRGQGDVLAIVLGLVLLCIPQVLYIYAYANSDAWGLSISIFLFIFLLTTKIKTGSYRYIVFLAGLVGLLILSKETFWLALPWVGTLGGAQYFQQRQQNILKLSLRQIATSFVIFSAIVFLIITPLRLIYPHTQGDWNAKLEEMRETRAWSDFKPSNPTSPGFHLAARDESIQVVVYNWNWYKNSLKSFYGVFGYFTVFLPDWVYMAAFAILMLNAGVTIGIAWSKWALLDFVTKVLLISAPFSILLNVAVSLYHSWTYDFQPQGRYLFASLIPFAVLLAGTVSIENKRCIAFRTISWLVCYVLCMFALINYALI